MQEHKEPSLATQIRWMRQGNRQLKRRIGKEVRKRATFRKLQEEQHQLLTKLTELFPGT